MSAEVIIDIARDAIWTIIQCSAPMLIVSLVIGLAVSLFQTVTSIQEQTLTFVPKFVAIMAIVVLAGNWILNTLSEYMSTLFSNFSKYIG